MKIKHLLPFILLFTLTLYSQGHKEKRERIKALKVSFITTELSLTSEESAKFWPVYNAFEEKEFTIRHDKMKGLVKKLDASDIDKMSEKEASSYLSKFDEYDSKLCQLRKDLINDLKPIIGSVKILKLKKAEDEFNRRLWARYKKRRE